MLMMLLLLLLQGWERQHMRQLRKLRPHIGSKPVVISSLRQLCLLLLWRAAFVYAAVSAAVLAAVLHLLVRRHPRRGAIEVHEFIGWKLVQVLVLVLVLVLDGSLGPWRC